MNNDTRIIAGNRCYSMNCVWSHVRPRPQEFSIICALHRTTFLNFNEYMTLIGLVIFRYHCLIIIEKQKKTPSLLEKYSKQAEKKIHALVGFSALTSEIENI